MAGLPGGRCSRLCAHASHAHANEKSTGTIECVPKRRSEKDKEGSYGFDSTVTGKPANREHSSGSKFDPVHAELIAALGVNDFLELLTNESLALQGAQYPTIHPQERD